MTTRTIHLVSLGCPKNRVDSERMAALAEGQGLELVSEPEAADVIIVNTCGFIESAKQESIDVLLELARFKEQGRCQQLIAIGCLAQRYAAELSGALPEVDRFLGTADLGVLARVLGGAEVPRVAVGPPEGLPEEEFPERTLGGPAHLAYLKIAEGCDRRCAFCSIPGMRGVQRSRSVGSLVDETRALVARGARELILVAQDVTAYGNDLGGNDIDRGEANLPRLLRALGEVEGLSWIRLLYAYPTLVSNELAEAMASTPKVVRYLDLPIQHGDDALLTTMRRGYGARHVRRAVARLREAMPDVVLRTTVLVGHPGETAEAHRNLLALLDELQLDNLGAFTFSAEEGTEAAGLPNPVDRALAEERQAEVMELQRGISRRRLAARRGQRLEVLVDGPSAESEYLLAGRFYGQAPEIDGQVVVTDGAAEPGELVTARITDSGDYDLVASLDPEG